MTPAIGTASPALAALRDELAALNAEFVQLLARRLDIARRVGAEKRAAGLATLDPRREAQVVAAVARHARQAGVPEESVRDIFWPVVAMCRRVQQEDAP
jgi:chorismate mutase